MATVQTVLDAIERIAPANTAFSFDKVGLQIGERSDEIQRGVVALDCSPGLLEFATTHGAQIAVCHHPVIWEPLAAVNASTRSGRLAVQMIRNGIAFIGSHTNWDAAPEGVNDTLAGLLGLTNVRPIGASAQVPFLKLVTFVPQANLDPLIDALSELGAGVIGLYERCAYSSEGTGTYRGLPGSHPTLGQAGQIETAPEMRLEMRLPESLAAQAISTLTEKHPYEEPAYDLYPLRPDEPRPIARIGESPAMSLAEFGAKAENALSNKCWVWGDPKRTITKVAVCGGAADGEWETALKEGADLFVTGEVRHHIAIEATEAGIAILAGGHYATEHPGCKSLCTALGREVPDVVWKLYEPPMGETGRCI